MPPPASCLYFTSAMSGSMPVVSQSIMKLIVPVGASTVACALRKPCTRPAASTSSHTRRAASRKSSGHSELISSTASRCICITRSIGSRFSSYAVERPDRLGQLAAGEVGRPVQQRGDRAAHAAGFVRIVRQCRPTSAGCPGSNTPAPAAGTGGCSGRCPASDSWHDRPGFPVR